MPEEKSIPEILETEIRLLHDMNGPCAASLQRKYDEDVEAQFRANAVAIAKLASALASLTSPRAFVLKP